MAHPLVPGDAAPFFHAAVLGGNPEFSFGTVGGNWVVLLFHGSGAWPASAEALRVVAAHRALFDDERACCFGVSIDPADVTERRIAPMLPGIRWFLDEGGTISRRYGAASEEDALTYRPHWLLLDPMLRVVEAAPIDGGPALMARLAEALAGWPPAEAPPAPVLVVPRVFEPTFCRRLIDTYEAEGGAESGFMVERGGVTVLNHDHQRKRRSDHLVQDGPVKDALSLRLRRFLLPMMQRAFQFEATRIERWLIACYDGDEGGGYFRAHRDNTTRGTAHRKFACTINLNAEDYDGGDLRFPEFSDRTYRAPTGGAVIFSCGLMHEALPVTRGRRYAFLPFFYDEAGAALRQRNLEYVTPDLANYDARLATGG